MADGDAMAVPTLCTAEFVLRELPSRCRVLEVGCGDGRLAAVLVANGHRVVGVDTDPEVVAAAKKRGVEARIARFPEGPDGPFDAVLFTRSLHHVDDLAGCLTAAARRLAPDGLVLIEDWAWEVMDAALLAHCACLAGMARDRGGVVDDAWEEGQAGVSAWCHEHGDHGLHTGRAIGAAVQARFTDVVMTTAPYAYRYMARYLAALVDARDVVAATLAAEQNAITDGAIPPLGRRWVARGARGS